MGYLPATITEKSLANQREVVRNERRALMELSDAGLKDLGLNRSDVDGEAARSFWDVPVDRLRP